MTAIKRHTEPLFFSPPLWVKSHLLPDGCEEFSSQCCRWASPLLRWAPVQQLNSPLLRAAIICRTIYLSQGPVLITTPRLMASRHMMNIIVHNTSGATNSLSLHAVPPFLSYHPPPWTPRSHHIVQGILGSKGNVKIKPYNRKGFCAFWFKLLLALCCICAHEHDTRKCSIDLHNNCMLEALLNSNEVLPKTF